LDAARFAPTGREETLRAGVAVLGLAETDSPGVAETAALVVAVVSASPKPILCARLVKMLLGLEGASRADDGRTSASGSYEVAAVAGAELRGGLTVGGMVPGAAEKAVAFTSDSPGSESPVWPPGSLAANTRFMPPSIPVLSLATGAPFEISLAISVLSQIGRAHV